MGVLFEIQEIGWPFSKPKKPFPFLEPKNHSIKSFLAPRTQSTHRMAEIKIPAKRVVKMWE